VIFVTGGAGFIGSNFVVDWIAQSDEPVLVIDKLTYAGNLANLEGVRVGSNLRFERVDICEGESVLALLRQHRPRALVHFAAESHVDRSIHGPGEFVHTNIQGTFALLEAVRAWLPELAGAERDAFRFLHVSTDEVYGSLRPDEEAFRETTPYAPNSPYAASKAASDHLVRAYRHTYGMPVITTNCSNNYGPFQFPEKLIPLMLLNALDGKALPIYGDGMNVRDWLYVGDHCAGIRVVLERGRLGETYNIGGRNEMTNISVVRTICGLLDELRPKKVAGATESYAKLMSFVPDRPGHDRRYAIDCTKIERELGWAPAESFESGIRKTIEWYLGAGSWINQVRSGAYREWIDLQYGRAA
jgi:dTDP-glucose 4,6-dehydratase